MRDRGAALEPAELERIASATARSAAALVAAGYGQPHEVRQKSSPTDDVTQTDLRAEELIRRLLHAATPEAGVLGEEGGTTAPGARLQWVIDPLDGTVNFRYGVPLFAVSVAAALDGEVVAGAVIDVLRDELFSAHLGGGARRNGGPIAASACTSLPDALVATGFSYQAELRATQGEVAHRVLARTRDLRCFGSAALELCWVACARVDAYFQRDTEIWDRAAGALIATESGARTELPCPENDDLVMAAAPGVFDDLWAVVQFAAA
ncbi:MAG TPA: inositol monophosphatase family protein [Solirubrobacteraceae bacterium]|nr:inositol monophosphatase family protein [Solirubrobacteraceae bacterium]